MRELLSEPKHSWHLDGGFREPVGNIDTLTTPRKWSNVIDGAINGYFLMPFS